MSAHTANHNLDFHLPSLSYVDAKWEEPNLRAQAQATDFAPKSGLFARMMTHFRDWRRARQAMSEFSGMTDYELADIGLSRSDAYRVFDPALSEDLQFRGRSV